MEKFKEWVVKNEIGYKLFPLAILLLLFLLLLVLTSLTESKSYPVYRQRAIKELSSQYEFYHLSDEQKEQKIKELERKIKHKEDQEVRHFFYIFLGALAFIFILRAFHTPAGSSYDRFT